MYDSHVGFVSVVDTEKMVSTIVKLIYLVFLFSFLFLYRKSIQLNAISEVTLLVEDPVWFLNDLLMAFKVEREKKNDD